MPDAVMPFNNPRSWAYLARIHELLQERELPDAVKKDVAFRTYDAACRDAHASLPPLGEASFSLAWTSICAQ